MQYMNIIFVCNEELKGGMHRVGSHVVSVRILDGKMADFFPHRCFKQK